jgi:hypothetical protein
MKKILLTLAAIPAATMAVEASAQTGYYSQSTNAEINVQNRILNLEARLNAGIQAGAIDRRERSILVRQLNDLRNLERQYSANGLSRSERQALNQRIRSMRDQLRMAGGGWANQYGWNDRDFDVYGNSYGATTVRVDQYGRTVDEYGRVIANSGYRVDQYGRPVDQYGRVITNGHYGQGGPYEPVPQSNGIGNVLGGVLGSVVGGGNGVGGILGNVLGGGGLSVGSVITGAIANALSGGSNFGYQDRSNVYFRSDGYQVYEIDARTNRVIRIHPIR